MFTDSRVPWTGLVGIVHSPDPPSLPHPPPANVQHEIALPSPPIRSVGTNDSDASMSHHHSGADWLGVNSIHPHTDVNGHAFLIPQANAEEFVSDDVLHSNHHEDTHEMDETALDAAMSAVIQPIDHQNHPNATGTDQMKATPARAPPPPKQQRNRVPEEMHRHIIDLHLLHTSPGDIAKMCDIRPKTVYTILDRYKQSGSIEKKKKRGGNRRTDVMGEEEVEFIRQWIADHPKATLQAIQTAMITENLPKRSLQTIGSVLHKYDCATPKQQAHKSADKQDGDSDSPRKQKRRKVRAINFDAAPPEHVQPMYHAEEYDDESKEGRDLHRMLDTSDTYPSEDGLSGSNDSSPLEDELDGSGMIDDETSPQLPESLEHFDDPAPAALLPPNFLSPDPTMLSDWSHAHTADEMTSHAIHHELHVEDLSSE